MCFLVEVFFFLGLSDLCIGVVVVDDVQDFLVRGFDRLCFGLFG